MKILIVSQYYYPEQFQINEIAPELVKRGHEVTVLTGLPNYPSGRIYNGYTDKSKREEIINGVRVIRVFEFPRGHGPMTLILNYLTYVVNAKRAALRMKNHFDIVIAYQLSPVTSALPAVQYAKKYGVPLLLYCLDIWPESAKAHLLTDRGIIYRYISALSEKIYRKCDKIAVTSRPFIEYLIKQNGCLKGNIIYLPQHSDSSLLEADLDAPDNKITDFMYAGNIGKGQVTENILYAAAELKNRSDFLIHMVGSGSQYKTLQKLALKLGISEKIIFYGNRKRSEMLELYKKADALLLTLRGNNFVGNTLPGKLQTYMSTGKPIFAAINGAAAEVIKKSNCGKCVSAGDYKGLSSVMADFIDNPDNYLCCKNNARNYFMANFTREIFMERLLTIIEDMTQK